MPPSASTEVHYSSGPSPARAEGFDNIGDVLTLVGLSVVTVVLCMLSAHDAWQAEIVPLLIFAMTVAISYDEDLALLIAAQVALVVAQGMDWGLASFVTLTSAAAAMIFWMGRIRNRSKLIYVGLWAGVVATLTQLGTGLLQERSLDLQMLYEAGRTGVWTLLAGFLMTGLLPFIERTFGVLTDLSLLEVGDVAHPLLQELVRRAPGTYNHSINVASLAEAAAAEQRCSQSAGSGPSHCRSRRDGVVRWTGLACLGGPDAAVQQAL